MQMRPCRIGSVRPAWLEVNVVRGEFRIIGMRTDVHGLFAWLV